MLNYSVHFHTISSLHSIPDECTSMYGVYQQIIHSENKLLKILDSNVNNNNLYMPKELLQTIFLNTVHLPLPLHLICRYISRVTASLMTGKLM